MRPADPTSVLKSQGIALPVEEEASPSRCVGALYSTHIVAPRTPNYFFALRDKLRMSSPDTPHSAAEIPFSFLVLAVLKSQGITLPVAEEASPSRHLSLSLSLSLTLYICL